jgi:phospho-N-acetylmuramoyl-pentapeptide-transferase
MIILAIAGLLIFKVLIRLLQQIKGVQPIYDKSPDRHQLKKNTVSFGGVGIILIFLMGQLMMPNLDPKVLWVSGVFLTFSWIGFMDDFLSVTRGKNMGLSAKVKFALQLGLAFAWLVIWQFGFNALLWWQWPVFLFLMVGSSNATNLTDGLDGLLAGLAAFTLIGFGWHFHLHHMTDLHRLTNLILIATLCFLVYNRYPARIFMGDTGSLAYGALFAALGIAAGNIWILIPLGSVYIIETLSVIIQVVVFKRTGKRVFKMAPLHHHFELKGWSERKVVLSFWAIGILSLAGYVAGTVLF